MYFDNNNVSDTSAATNSNVNTTMPIIEPFVLVSDDSKLKDEWFRKFVAEQVLSIVEPLESIQLCHAFEKILIRSIYLQCAAVDDRNDEVLRILCTSLCHLIIFHVLFYDGRDFKFDLTENLKPEATHIIITRAELLHAGFSRNVNSSSGQPQPSPLILLETLMNIASGRYYIEDDQNDSIQGLYFAPALIFCDYLVTNSNNISNDEEKQQLRVEIFSLFARHMFMTGGGSGKSTATPLEVFLCTPLLSSITQVEFDACIAGPLKFKLLSDKMSAINTILQIVKVWILDSTTTTTTTTTTNTITHLVDLSHHYETPTNLVPAATSLLLDSLVQQNSYHLVDNNNNNTSSNLGKELLIHLLLYASCFKRATVLVVSLKVISLCIVENLLQLLLRNDSTSTGYTRTHNNNNNKEDFSITILSLLDKVAKTYLTVIAATHDETLVVQKDQLETSTFVLSVLNQLHQDELEKEQHDDGNNNVSMHILETLESTLESWHKIYQRSTTANNTTTPVLLPSISISTSWAGLEEGKSNSSVQTLHAVNGNYNDEGVVSNAKLDRYSHEYSAISDVTIPSDLAIAAAQAFYDDAHDLPELKQHGTSDEMPYNIDEMIALSDSTRSAKQPHAEPFVSELPIAYAVQPNTTAAEVGVVYAEPVLYVENNNEKKRASRRRTYIIICGIVTVLTITGIAIAVALTNGNKNKQGEGRTEDIFRQLKLVSGSAIYDQSLPQGKAASWLANDDERGLQSTDSQLLQRYALAVLYFSTGGDDQWTFCRRSNHNNSCMYIRYREDNLNENDTASPYLSKDHECQWMGNECLSSEGEIRTLSIPLNNLNGTLPSEISQLSILQEVDFRGNNLHGTLPESLGQLISLERLNVRDNFLTGLIPEQLFSLTKLKSIALEQNMFNGTLSKNWGKLVSLQTMFLSKNYFSGTLPSEIGALNRLSQLWLEGCGLQGTLPSSLGKLGALRELYLSENSFTGTIPYMLNELQDLRGLNLNMNSLTGTIPKFLTGLSNLEQLSLSWNYLSGTLPSEIGRMTNLYDLQLKNNGVLGTITEQLGNIKNLSVLDLSLNYFSGTIPSLLGQLENLAWLDLSQNLLTGTIPAPSSLGWTRIESLYLFNNSFTGSVPEAVCLSHENVSKYILVDCQQNLPNATCISQCCAGFTDEYFQNLEPC